MKKRLTITKLAAVNLWRKEEAANTVKILFL
jgi:hypothetical protein